MITLSLPVLLLLGFAIDWAMNRASDAAADASYRGPSRNRNHPANCRCEPCYDEYQGHHG